MIRADLIIIGSGPGGYRAAEYAAKNGLQVVVVEELHAGGTCLNEGCIPTKTMCHEADKMEVLRQFAPNTEVNFNRVVERLKNVVETLRAGVETLMTAPGITFIKGHAHFKDAKTIIVKPSDNEPAQEYSSENIIIATGASPKMPPGAEIEVQSVMTSSDILRLTNVPKHLIIIGAGVIGMEFASVFNSFGSKVTVIEFLKECLPTIDSDIAKRLRKSLEKKGVNFFMQSSVKGVKTNTVTFERKGKTECLEGDVILVATGRKPNVEGLNLEAIGIKYSGKGISVDENMRTNVPGIYAIGDVNGRMMLAHAATMQGIRAVNHILKKQDEIRLDIMPAAVFTHPEVASVGLTEDQCKAAGIPFICNKAYYRANGKALSMEETDGIVKLVANENGKIIGCHILGAHAADMVQEIAALMNRDTTIGQLRDIVHIHPTLGELVQEAAMMMKI